MAVGGVNKLMDAAAESGGNAVSKRTTMSGLTRNGTAGLLSRDQILRHERGQGNIHFPCSDHEQDWQSYPVDLYSAISSDDHTYIDYTGRMTGPDCAVFVQFSKIK